MRFMQRSKDTLAKWLSAILPVVIVGLVGLFAVTVIRDYGRASEADRQALLEKGNVLIRALESGSRVGMGMRMHHVQQQALLEEMAGQPGVLWFAVTDAQGIIILHSDPEMVGRALYSPDEMRQLKPEENSRWRLLEDAEKTPALEVYRLFQPMSASWRHGMHNMPRCNGKPEPQADAYSRRNAVND